MAVGDIEAPGTGRKRKRRIERRLIVDEKVEVRSLEDGFLGSWHDGTVIACNNGVRHVMYDHLLLNDGSNFLVDAVAVSAVLDDANSSVRNSDSRGYIRPIPPTIGFGKWGLPYGLCVDVNYQDAWWEGVIFDHEDGSEERRVFFPDLGDELKVGIETLRITQDWDEATGDWQRRGTWSFLELIDQCEQESYLPVSLKQIWYEVRAKKDFMKIGEWTFPMNNLWKELVMEVIDENLEITLKEMLRVLEICSSVGSELGKANVCINKNPLVNLVDFDAIAITGESAKSDLMISNDFNQENAFDACGLVMEEVPKHDGLDTELLDSGPNSSNIHLAQEKSQLDDDNRMKTSNDLGFSCHDEALSMLPKASSSSVSVSDARGFSGASAISHQRLPIIKYENVNKQLKCSGRGNSYKWKSLSATTLPDAALCPDAVTEYLLLGREKPTQTLIENARKHLLYLGWKIECRQGKPILRYTHPDGKCFYSLRQVCKLLTERSAEIPPPISKDETRNMHDPRQAIFPSRTLEHREGISSPENCSQTSLDDSGVVLEKPEFLHKAVMDYYNLSQSGSNGMKNLFEMQLKARRDLLSLGWRLIVNNKGKGGRQRWYYTSPLGRTCASLSTACKICLDEEGVYESTESACRRRRRRGNIYVIKGEGQIVRNKFYSAPSNMDVQECSTPSNSLGTFFGESRRTSPSKDLVEFSHDKFQRTKKLRSRANLFDFSPHLLQSQHKLDCKEYKSGIQTVYKKYVRRIRNCRAAKQNLNRGSVSRGVNKFSDDMERRRSMRVSRSSKRVHEVVTPSPSHHNPRTVISWLIDNNMVLPRAKVYYCRERGHRPMAEGRISRDGIKCCCCQKVFTVNGFQIHAGNTSSRSAANILLEDGKSLLECQILCNKKTRNFKREAFGCRKGNDSKVENDYICSICHFGGTLILCDQCPSSFHQSCLGLKDIPEGDWFCPSCCCGICGQNKLNEHTKVVDNPFLTCYQCERKYHVKCLGIKETQNIGSYPTTYWFCNKHCKEIHWGLQRLLGKSIPVGGDNLTWSLLKATNSDTHYLNPPHVETLTENQSKLNVALSVMHECFEPVKEHYTSRDIVDDVIFSRRSDLQRLNFQGFYTVLLERNDELVSVAAIRVYGEKVAEIPLVGTRFQYRRLGMCRILMNELEERLRDLGVQRLVLPAVSSVLNAWTTSFGFSRMTDSERLEFLNYTFLDFQETVMCQKFLLKNAVVPHSLTGNSELHDDVNKTSNSTDNVCGSSAITEFHPTAHTEESGILSREQVETSAGNNSDNSPGLYVVNVEKLKNHLQDNTSSHIEKFPVCLAEGYKHFGGLQQSAHDYLKYYRRRSKLISC